MAFLTFWIAEQGEDSACYNIIAKTKKDCLAQMAERPDVKYQAPVKVVFQYSDAFDLFHWATSEGGGRHTHYSGG